MSDFTTKATGNYESTGATTWNEASRPVSGDKITAFNKNVTVNNAEVVGESPSTGGNPAITWDNSGTLLIATGGSLTLQGDLSPASGLAVVQVNAGGQLIFLPASGQQYRWRQGSNSILRLLAVGSLGSPAIIKTDKSLGGLAAAAAMSFDYYFFGLKTADYAEFTDLGTTTQWGFLTVTGDSSSQKDDVSITRTAFLRSNLKITASSDRNVTIQYNTFTSSPLIATGYSSACFQFNAALAGTTAVWLIDTNGFDGAADLLTPRARTQFSNNVCKGVGMDTSGGSWSLASKFSGNILYQGEQLSIRGPSQNCLHYFSTVTNNPHFQNNVISGADYTGWIFQAAGGPFGDIIFPPGSGTIEVTRCMTLPASDGTGSSGGLLSCHSTVAPDYLADHNTHYGRHAENSMFGMDETAASVTAQARSVRGNYIWSDSAVQTATGINSLAPTTSALDSVTLAGTNGFWNPTTGTCRYNTTTVQANVVGYNGLRITANTPYPNTQGGDGDVTVSADALVDKTENFETAAQTCLGSDGTAADAFAKAVLDPIAATDPTTGIIALIKAAQQVTGAAGLQLQNAAWDGDTIGAMGYVAPASTGRTGMDNRRMRPYGR